MIGQVGVQPRCAGKPLRWPRLNRQAGGRSEVDGGAPEVVGLGENETDLPIREHTTDTHGATLVNFGLFDRVGTSLTPRVRDLGKITMVRGDSPAATNARNGADAPYRPRRLPPVRPGLPREDLPAAPPAIARTSPSSGSSTSTSTPNSPSSTAGGRRCAPPR
ncbi:Tn3 family transposase [Streptosporangium canum]|uniref:Tn3 family transposase n=1 Tax=Streptosporangium canum TaxID=324952 RepID=UPI00368B4E11